MRRMIPALMVATLTLTACGGFRDSAANPRNWFGRSTAAPVVPDARDALLPEKSALSRPEVGYQGQRVEQVSELSLERIPGGAMIRAAGIAERQGAYDVRLVPQGGPDKGVQTYEMQVQYPPRATSQGPAQTRVVTAALAMTEQQLEGVRTVRVVGLRNQRTSSR